jgi:hypothetical protein
MNLCIRAYERDFVGRRYGAIDRSRDGASSGIGLHTALGLARAGMRVVMTGRDRTRTELEGRFLTCYVNIWTKSWSCC